MESWSGSSNDALMLGHVFAGKIFSISLVALSIIRRTKVR